MISLVAIRALAFVLVFMFCLKCIGTCLYLTLRDQGLPSGDFFFFVMSWNYRETSFAKIERHRRYV